MKIVYERLFNLGNYSNERIAVEDETRPDETPVQAYDRLRALVYEMAEERDPAAPKRKPAEAAVEDETRPDEAPVQAEETEIPF